MPGNNETFNVTIKAGVDLSGVEQQAKKLKGLFSNIDFKIPKGVSSSFDSHYESFNNLFKQYQEQLNKGFDTKAQVNSFKKLGKAVASEINNMIADVNKLNNSNVSFNIDTSKVEALSGRVGEIREQIQTELANLNLPIDFDKMFAGASKSSKLKEMLSEFQNTFNSGDMQAASSQIDKIVAKINSLTTTKTNMVSALGLEEAEKRLGSADAAITEFFGKLKTGLQNVDSATLTKLFADLGLAEKDLTTYLDDANNKVKTHIETMQTTGEVAKESFRAGSAGAESYATSVQSAKQQLDSLRQSTEYFFGLKNMFNLLKRGIREAIQTVSELDKAMTETAVVTNFSVGDMWAKLPLYTEQANKLGSTIKDVYEATTLYYQQGLDTDQAIGLANETLKMARIAGLDAADATDAMTAALRGFNMEINETSAQRINDVYSEIAAKTASDTEELSTAMSKTASLAHSAGMSFEGTTAFLAQMIETTREAPENLGTAMKTIIARFQEMKKNPLEIVDVEGEEVSYNKIDTALQSIGVSLKDANGQFRNLDEVFLEIASKWDSLTQTQQRYIATTAAGSRQQSRFIAMMSNYERVTQLVEYANDSAGASQEQFGKTLESFEAKVNKLKTAWQEFLMGIANNTIIKKSIDALTKGLSAINKAIDTLSGKSDVLRSILSLGTAFIGLRAAGKVLNRLVGGIGGFLDPNSSFGKGFRNGGVTTLTVQAEKISNPIVQAIHQLQAAITKQPVNSTTPTQNSASFQDFRNAQTGTYDYIKANQILNFSDLYGHIGKLDNRQQKLVLQQLPGLALSLKNEDIKFNFDDKNISKEAQNLVNTFTKEVQDGFKEGSISGQDMVKIFGNADDFQTAMAARGEKYAKVASDILYDGVTREQAITREMADRSRNLSEEEAEKIVDEQAQKNFARMSSVAKTEGADIANKLGKIGSNAVIAGQGIAQLGMQLSNAGFKEAGAAVTQLGYTISSLGQIAASAGTVIGNISKAGGLGAIISAHPVITAILIAVTAIGAGIALWQSHLKKVREAAEEVVKTFEETNKATTDNIATLQQFKDELATLSKGVDENGYNVSLSTTDYDRYLEIVDKIAEINPDIVDGYNAQGHAIINNNKALEETIRLQEQIQKEAVEEYTSEESLSKLLAARNLDKTYTAHVSYVVSTTTPAKDADEAGTGSTTPTKDQNQGYGGYGQGTGSKTIFSKEVDKILNYLEKNNLDTDKFKATLQDTYGINYDDLKKGDYSAIKAFTQNEQKILSQLQYQFQDNWDKIGDGAINLFGSLETAMAEVQAANQPIFQQVSTWANEQGLYDEIPAEYRSFISSGINDIINLTNKPAEIRKQTRKLVKELDNEFGANSKYADVMERAAEIKQDFTDTLNKTEYHAQTEPLIKELEELQRQAKEKGGAAGEALYNAYAREINNLRNFTEDGAASIAQALNPLSDEIASAEGAFAAFEEKTGSVFSTAATNMKQFLDVINDETHNAGLGDSKYWGALEELLGRETIKDMTRPEQAQAYISAIEPLFEKGAKGYNNFVDYLNGFKNDLDPEIRDLLFNKETGQLQFDFDDSDIPKIAEALHMSENTFVALLNKARQFANIQFDNIDELRTALATTETTVYGTQENSSGQKNLYVNEDQLVEEMRAADVAITGPQIEEKLNELREQGIVTIPGPNSISADTLQQIIDDVDIQNLDDVIATFSKMGFGKEDVLKFAQTIIPQLTGEEFDAEKFQVAYSDYLATENIDPAIAEGNALLGELVTTTQAIRTFLEGGDIQNGRLSDANARFQQLHDTAFGESGVTDTLLDYFKQGLDANGNKLTAQTLSDYVGDSGELTKFLADIHDYKTQLETGKDNATTDEQRQLYEDELRQVTQLEKDVNQAIEMGQQSYNNLQTIAENTAKEADTESDKGSPSAISIGLDTSEISGLIQQKSKLKEHLADIQQQMSDVNTELINLRDTDPTNPRIGELQQQFNNLEQEAKNTEGQIDDVSAAILRLVRTPFDIKIKFSTLLNGQNAAVSVITAAIQSIKGGSSVKGHNNYISSSGFYTGSAARGEKGTLGPNNRGGLTLTGEEGFEVAWLPSENRSMIVGAYGPQMVDLPSDAIVWNHEQSKKIVKQQGIPLGSMKGGTPDKDVTSDPLTHWNDPVDVNIVSDKTSSGSGSSSSKDKDKDPKHSNWYKEEVRRFNLNQSINQLTEKIEKITKSISDTLEKLGVKYSDISKDVEKQTQLLHQTIAQQQQLRDSYKAELEWLANGNRQLWVSLTNASNESEEISVGTSQFISGNADTGYSVSYDAIVKYLQANGYGGENLTANAESLFNLLNQQISNLQSSFNSAAKAIEDAQQKLKDLVNQIREAFYGWENELTRVYDLSKQLELNEAMNGRFTSEIGLLLSSVSTQFEDMATILGHLNDAQQGSIELTKQRLELLYAMIQARQEEIEALMDGGAAEKERYEAIKAENEAALKNGQALTAEMLAREAAAYDEYARAAWGQLYVTSTQNADGSYTFDFNEEQLEADRLAGKISEDTYNAIKDGFDNLVEGQIDYHEAISEVQDYLKELGEQLDDYYKTMADLENNLIDAFVDAAQKEVSKLEALNSSLTSAAKSVLEQVKKSIDARRKAEDNAKTEADIARKQERLSILRANTGGGNQVEIAQLEKEISDAQRSYGRTLEDQMLAQMQTQADEASKQRQQQIDLAKQQIEYNKQAGVYAAMADELLDDIKANATQITLLLDETKELGRGKWEQLIDKNEIERQIIEAGNASAAIPYLEEAISQQQDLYNALIQLDQDMMEVVGTTIGQGQNNPDTPGVYNPTNGGIPTTGSTSSGSPGGSSGGSSGGGTANTSPNAHGRLAGVPAAHQNTFSSAQKKALQQGLNDLKKDKLIGNFGADLVIDGIIGPKTTAAIVQLQKAVGTTQDGIWGPNTGNATHKKFPKYARGGLNKTTGPAWLDGTRAKPELVLNAQDTKNFIALKDILSGVMRTISHTDTSNIYSSPTEFNINVNVEKIASDYDVDRLAARIKRDIVKDATYRNVTAVRNFR